MFYLTISLENVTNQTNQFDLESEMSAQSLNLIGFNVNILN